MRQTEQHPGRGGQVCPGEGTPWLYVRNGVLLPLARHQRSGLSSLVGLDTVGEGWLGVVERDTWLKSPEMSNECMGCQGGS